MVSQAVGFDRNKFIKGGKRFLAVDTFGWCCGYWSLLPTSVSAKGGRRVLKPVKQMGSSVSRLHTIWVDAGFEGEPFMQSVMNFCGWTRACACQQTKPSWCSKTWVVERTFGWLIGYRRLLRDYELLPQTSETFIYLAIILLWSGVWHRI